MVVPSGGTQTSYTVAGYPKWQLIKDAYQHYRPAWGVEKQYNKTDSLLRWWEICWVNNDHVIQLASCTVLSNYTDEEEFIINNWFDT